MALSYVNERVVPMLTPARADRNLLGGVLALQMDFVTGDQLLAAMKSWALRKDTPLLDLLRQGGALSGDAHEALSRLVEVHIARHGDAGKSLAAVPLDAAIRSLVEETKHPGSGTGHGSTPMTSPNGSSASTRPSARAGTADGPRFRRVRSHAKGGLGEVFLAEDAELRREVALKEIQDQYADYEDSRSRFIREAEITGQLEHPGVVPIYGLGVYGDGRPYYAMRFIRGESLQTAIDRFHEADRAGKRDPGERALALRGLLGRFVAVCNAVGYAHSRDIIHRDIKPANVMLGDYGETLVVDWGLARRMADDEERTLSPLPIQLSEDGARTQQGQAVGTPHFMPPEQALGELERVGPASDVFSLGATLYSLLTGKTPYGGPDVLIQAAECRCAKPREANATVPPALEAVCVKAMARKPEDRYAKARDLAADVDRWLGDEPVSAYREPLMPRVGRWARRNRTMVSSILVLLLAGVTALSVGLVVVGREQAATAKALERALTAEDEAKGNLVRAEENLRLARKAVDECFDIAKDHPRFQEAGLRDVKKLLLEKALPFYKNFRVQRPDDVGLDERTALLFFRVAYITNEIGSKKETLAFYENAREIQSKLVSARPALPEYQNALASTHYNLGVLLEEIGRRDEALEAYHQSRAILEKIANAHPAVREYRHNLATTHYNLGIMLGKLGRREEALKAYHEAGEIQRDLAATHPGVFAYQNDLAYTLHGSGNVLFELGKHDESLTNFRLARRMYGKLAAESGNNSFYRVLMGGTEYDLACSLAILGAPAKKTNPHSVPNAMQQSEKLSREAVRYLTQAQSNGYFANPVNRKHMMEDADIHPLRDRADFKAFLATLPKSP